MMRPHTLDTSAMLRLRKHNLYAREDKCSFHQTSVEYLGYILLPEGLTMAEDKVKCILEWPEPRKVKDIWTWTNFIKNFAKLFSMLNKHTKPWLTPNNFQHQTSRLETSCLSKHNSLEQCILPRNLPRSFWVLLKSLHILVLT